ncbi:MAG TPA: YihY/virulence factor BrkB family protein [Promineifilum sp.]|nr:YihY/virulence factor BrkB family protein [Promineifilum sp.]
MMERLKSLLFIFRDALGAYFKDRAAIYAAGGAYYAVFSVAPLLVFMTAIVGLFIGHSTAGEQIALQLQFLVGPQLADFLAGLMETLTNRTANTTATILALIGLFIGAGGIFNQLRTALNLLWGITDVRPVTLRDWLYVARRRIIPFLMVFVFGLLFSLTFVIEAVLEIVRARFEVLLPEAVALLPSVSRFLIPLLTFVTFYLIFKLLPDAHNRRRDVAVGALVTTILFLIGRRLLIFFLSLSNTGSLYGAAGSIVILLIWVYFSAQILLYGAEFTRLYAQRHGHPIRPNRMAIFLMSDELQATSDKR